MTSSDGDTSFEWEDESYGKSRTLFEEDTLLIKEVLFLAGFTTYQRHIERAEYWQIIDGRLVGVLGVEPLHMRGPSSFMVAPGAWHWLGGTARVIVTWLGDWLDESDFEVGKLP